MARVAATTAPAAGALIRTVTVAGRSIKLFQHFMDTPVAQPRRRGGPKADLTGLKVWPVSLRMLEHLRQTVLPDAQQRAGDRPLRVLELGAGCGSLGIGLASLGVHCLLTDPGLPVNYSETEQGNTLSWLRANVDANRELLGERAAVAQLLWNDASHTEAVLRQWPEPFDLVVGSDLLYDPDQYAKLVGKAPPGLSRSPPGGARALLCSPEYAPLMQVTTNVTRCRRRRAPTLSATRYPALLRTLAIFAGDAETRVVLGYTRRHPGEARFIKSAQLAFEEVATTDMAAREHTPRWSVTVMRGCR